MQQFSFMLRCPFNDKPQCARWTFSFQNSKAIYLGGNFFFPIAGMKMRGIVIIKEHRNYYSIKSADFRHCDSSFLFWRTLKLAAGFPVRCIFLLAIFGGALTFSVSHPQSLVTCFSPGQSVGTRPRVARNRSSSDPPF